MDDPDTEEEEEFLPHIQKRGPPRLIPEESTQRAAQIACDMCVMNVQYMNTLSMFLPLGELFHVQMHLLYGLIDTMSATSNINQDAVLHMMNRYFKSLRTDEREMKGTRRHGENAAYLERRKHRK